MPKTGPSPAVRASCHPDKQGLSALLQMLDGYCLQHQVSLDDQHDLHLIVEEACINVIEHGHLPGTTARLALQVQAKVRDGRALMEVTIEDQGQRFNPLKVQAPDPLLPLEDRPLGGIGIDLIRHLSDVQRYHHDARRGNVLTLTKFLSPVDTA